MAEHKLKVRVGTHEFEAEGPQDVVERQFTAWKELLALAPAAPTAPTPPIAPPPREPGAPGTALPGASSSGSAEPEVIGKLFRREGQVVSLTVLPRGDRREADAALLLLLGHKVLAGSDEITGARLLQGMKRSGLTVPRADRVFGAYMESFVIRSGMHRAVRYRLTNPGYRRAHEMAAGLLGGIP